MSRTKRPLPGLGYIAACNIHVPHKPVEGIDFKRADSLAPPAGISICPKCLHKIEEDRLELVRTRATLFAGVKEGEQVERNKQLSLFEEEGGERWLKS